MKSIFISILLLFTISIFATKTTSISSGNWTTGSTWSNGVPPGCYDTIVISAGHTVTVNPDVDLTGCSPPIYIIVKGHLYIDCYSIIFGGSIGYVLDLPSGSAVSVQTGGTVDGCGDFFGVAGGAKIKADGTTIYDSRDGEVTGPDYIGEDGTDLPVELLSFDSKFDKNSVNIYWQTATEINSDYFELQHSANGENWETIALLGAAGNSNMLIDYSFVDQNPLIGDNYYRLHQVDFDGKDEYFGPIYQNFANSDITTQLRIYPNPNTEGLLTIKTSSNMQYADVIEIFDIAGRLQKTITVSEEVNSIQINISDLKKGIYIIRYQNQDTQFTERLIIQ